MSSAQFMLNPVPMTFKLKSFEIVLDFKDGEDKMTLKLSEQKGDSADVVKLMVRDKNNFAIFRGSKTEDGEANDDFAKNMDFSASGTLIRDEDLVSFALMWVTKLMTELQNDIVILNVEGRMIPFWGFFVPEGNMETDDASNQERDNTEDEIIFEINGALNDIMRNFADLMDHFLT